MKVPRRVSCPLIRIGTPWVAGWQAQGLGHAVIDRSFALRHLLALLEQSRDLGMDVKARRVFAKFQAQPRELFLRHSGINFVSRRPFAANESAPVIRKLIEHRLLGHGPGVSLGLLIARLSFCYMVCYVDAEPLCVDFIKWRVSLDFGIDDGLCDRRVIDLRVAVATVADQINEHVRAELIAVVQCHPSDANDRVRIFRIHMEDRNRQALSEIAGKAPAGILAGIRSESEQVVDNDVDAAAYAETLQAAQVEGLCTNALPGKGGVAVHEDRQRLAPAFLATPSLLGAHSPQRHGIDRLKMAGVADQANLHAVAVELAIAARAVMIFHVSAAEDGTRIDVFKASVNVGGRAAHGVANHGQASTMAHRHYAFFGAMCGGSGEDLLHQRYQRGIAFQRETLGADVERLEHLLEDVGFHQLLQNGFAIDLGLRSFQAVDDPLAALRIRNVHELSPDRAAVDFVGALGVRTAHAQL